MDTPLLSSLLHLHPSLSLALTDELEVLSSIYSLTSPSLSLSPCIPPYQLSITLSTSLSDSDDEELNIQLSIPHSYPTSERPPQLSLVNLYIGPYAVPTSLYTEVSNLGKEEWDGRESLWEGVEGVRELCRVWMEGRRERDGREEEKEVVVVQEEVGSGEEEVEMREERAEREVKEVRVWRSEVIVDRKSVFIGHAAVARSIQDVEDLMHQLLQDKKIAKATHNILAYRITGNGIVLADNDDDGESAAGSRLGHLLGLLDVKDVVIVVSRWYGGIQLGADRFKHINSAARDALVVGGFLDAVEGKKKGKK